jgi:hypothetical protein
MRVLFTIALATTISACGDDGGPASGRDSGVVRIDAGGGGMDAGPGADGGPGVDAGEGLDAGVGTDSGALDGGPAPMVDAGTCAFGADTCGGGTMCLCCPAGGPAMNCLCTTACGADGDCTDPDRSTCNRPEVGGSARGICTPVDYRCLWGAICASPDTPIATPSGERAIRDLREGDLVYSVHDQQLVAVPIQRVGRTAVTDHVVVRIGLDNGRFVSMSPGHPTADGRTFGDLGPGDDLGGSTITTIGTMPFEHPFTHDILPASDTGQYFAAGARVGSTLFR